ncbi:DDB1- and CUL4-associated factor 15 isoform X2 [Chiloscyllium plagiosum]|uniref:DDB1- and CUL4-associated factor 15 isoform X2 n=1 Tax=Chiloscyllium plagiosum TaxID=36176 RepID=UPI001CB85EED|nr:DDB1- and CUL4-associated factor 15 isoform X2 [Chiloscyllium plagiosum]
MPVAGGKVEEFPGQPCAAKKLEPAVTIRSCIITGQFSHRMFQNLPPILCVPLKNIVDDDFLLAGHIFLGFTKCGRYVLSYTRDVPEQDIDELPYYVYYLYWWKFNIHDKLKKVRQVHLFKDQEVYSDLYLTVCEWPSDPSKLIVFGFNIRSVNDLLINMVMSDENDRDIYITTVATPPFSFCPDCKDMALLSTDEQNAYCLQHGFMLHTKYQVVYPFPTFQPAFQLKKDGVVLLNTSYSLVACAISVNTTDEKGQILYSKSSENTAPPGHSELDPNLISPVMDDVMSSYLQCEAPSHPSSSHGGPNCILHKADTTGCAHTEYCPEEMLSWELKSSKHGGLAACNTSHGYDDKISLHFVVTDLRGRNLKPVKESALYQGKYLTVEQLTLDFEYVINEIIRNDASWSKRYCSFSDYDIVILEVCPITNHVIINIGLLLLAYPSDEEGQIRPKTYHTCLKGTWNLNTGVFATMGVGDLTAVQGQTSGSVWSTFRKSCVDIAMRWLVPESTFRNVNRMTNEALHKGRSLKRLADSGRSMWIVL